MPVSGLIIHADTRQQDASARLTEQLNLRPEFTLGAAEGCRLSAVLDTPDEDANRSAWRWLQSQPDIAHVDVICVYFDQAAEPTPT